MCGALNAPGRHTHIENSSRMNGHDNTWHSEAPLYVTAWFPLLLPVGLKYTCTNHGTIHGHNNLGEARETQGADKAYIPLSPM